MATLTKQEWLNKIKKNAPSWVFEKEQNTVAFFGGLGALFAAIQEDVAAQIRESYINTAQGNFLDLHGEERGLTRFLNENDFGYRSRIKTIKNKSNFISLRSLVNSILVKGEATFIENNNEGGFFVSRNSFCNRGIIDFPFLINAFTIIIDEQKPEVESFVGFSFASRGDFMGSKGSIQDALDSIVRTVNENKGFGIFYRLIERA